ncbi:MAG: tyrosine-type recombinase/integrase [Candidatus Dormibacteria bacterium]
MSKRVMHRGSVYRRRDGRWAGAIVVDGVRSTVYAPTQEEAVRKLQALQGQTLAGLPIADQRVTVARFLRTWLEDTCPRLRPSTSIRYRQIVEGQLIPSVGRVRLTKLSPQDVARMMLQVQEAGLSVRTAAHCRAVLRAALADAERWGLVHRNVGRLADAPHLAPPQPVVLAPDDVRRVLEACADPALSRLVTVAIATGLRLGEQLGARWSDVDLDKRCLTVRAALQRVAGAYVLVEPKSATSRRVVALPDLALEALREEHQAQIEAQLAAGRRWYQPIPDLVFTTALGAPRNGTSVIHLFQDALQRASLARLRWHDLRAAHGALLLASGTDISVVSRALGHSSVSLTSRHYGGVAEALQQDAAERLGRMLRRPS